MTMKKKQQTMTKQNNYYFWLGPDGEIDVVTEDQFERLQKKSRRDRSSDPREN